MGTYSSFDLFIIKHQLELTTDDWNDISEKYFLSNDMIRVFQNKVNWRKIAQYQELTTDFIQEFIHYQLKEYIDVICKYQELSEEFIHEHRDIVDWELILQHQKVSNEFILNHVSDIHTFKNGHDEVD